MSERTDNESDKQPRGILSPADREYLTGEKELAAGAERNARQRIRERVRAGLSDFELLWDFLPNQDLEQVFYPDDSDGRKDLRSSSQHALAFILLGLWTNRDPHAGRLENAIEQAAFANDWLADASVKIDIEQDCSGDLLLAKIKHKEERIQKLCERIEQDDLTESGKSDLEQEVEKEATLQYYLFEKGLFDPTVDAEGFASISMLGEEIDLEPDDIKASQKGWGESPFVRPTLPIVVDIGPHFEGEQE